MVEEKKKIHAPESLSFAPNEEEHLLQGTRIHGAMKQMTSYYIKNGFRTNDRRVPKEFRSAVMSTVAVRLKLGQGVSWFCPELIHGGDKFCAFFLFGQLFDEMIECRNEKGSNMGACKA